MDHVLQPSQEETPPDDPQVFGLEEESTEKAMDALASGTARELFAAINEETRTPTELRDAIGTSLQNVHYHLENLESAGLIRPVGTRFSEKGTEMTVYGPASEAVVFMAGDDEDVSLLRRALARVVGGLGVLAAASLAVSYLFGGRARTFTGEEGERGVDVAAESPQTAAEGAGAATGLDPGLVFFLGGVFVLAIVGAWWLYRETR